MLWLIKGVLGVSLQAGFELGEMNLGNELYQKQKNVVFVTMENL